MEPIEFGRYLRSLRKQKKITIRQLELYSGVSHAYLSQIENGKRGLPSPEILRKLSKPLEVPYEELMYKAGYIDFIEVPDDVAEGIRGNKISRDDLVTTPVTEDGKIGLKIALQDKVLLDKIKEIAKKHNMELTNPRFLQLVEIAFDIAERIRKENID